MKYIIPIIIIFSLMVLGLAKTGAIKREPGKPVIDQKNVKARFLTNYKIGTLFVINGMVTNTSSGPITDIEIKGTLGTSDNSGFVSQRAYCGNMLTDIELKTLSVSDISDRLNTKHPGSNNPPILEPNKRIPFMVVFPDLPANLKNFTVHISDFKQHGIKKEVTIYDKALVFIKSVLKPKEEEWKK